VINIKLEEYFPAFTNCHLSELSRTLRKHCSNRQRAGNPAKIGITHLWDVPHVGS
jgi:hypothetical protein